MPKGRPFWKYRPQDFRVLEVMGDGMWYCRPTLRERTGLSKDALSPAIQRNYRRGRIIKRRNPHHNHSEVHGTLKHVGVKAAALVYRITEEGREALERERESRERLAFRGFDDL